MTRLTIVIIAAALLGAAALLSVAHAQEATGQPIIAECQALSPPSQLSPPAGLPATGTGSISGQIVVLGPPVTQIELEIGVVFVYAFFVIPADTPQPIDIVVLLDHGIDPDVEGNFTVSNLSDGDYLIVWLGVAEVVTPLPEIVCVVSHSNQIGGLPALRVIVANGQPVTGIEIVVRRPEPVPYCTDDDLPLSPPDQLSPPSDVSPQCVPDARTGPVLAPVAGTGPAHPGSEAPYIAAGLAGLVALVLTGGAYRWAARPRP